MATKANPTPEERALIEAGRRAFEEAENLPPPSARFQAKMDDQARTHAALARPGPERDAYRRVMDMPRDAFEAEFDDVVNANADDEEPAP